MSTQLPAVCGDAAAAAQRLIAFYEQLSPERLASLDAYYAPDAHFKDPFNDVRGLAAIARIFEHMFATLDQPRFTVIHNMAQGDQAFLGWEFRFRMRRWRPQVEQCIQGATLVRFDAQGRVAMHRDYWDAAEELYEKLPVLGSLMRWLRRSACASGPARRSSS
ncbi:nuclear transport factor 2 family protein [Bordetella avium]|uniref:nuclear transport factor 2 family protein n=1 Tax=Bordetella avium TaxID=521 RepID=UPI000E68734B|nr:nuclear transport factor 2 family protein [Bordetella avium]AZY52745.1 isomerase [Bordetella avium]RIQ69344.1 nuclear transport factor 2 family protein [Bordetella avium]